MRLGMETTPFDPASHTIGVHNIALHTAILAKKAGFPVDLPLVSAAALGHDIGKFGCRGADLEPDRLSALLLYLAVVQPERYGGDRLHLRQPLDLRIWKFENLPIESLLLIYADFRVRGTRRRAKKERHAHLFAQGRI